LPPELVASKPFAPAADGRGWKYFAPVKFCASNAEPRTPDLSTSKLPLAWLGKSNWDTPNTTSGYKPHKMTAKKIVATMERPNSVKMFFIVLFFRRRRREKSHFLFGPRYLGSYRFVS